VPGGAINPLWQAPTLREACQTDLVWPLPLGSERFWRVLAGGGRVKSSRLSSNLQLAAGSWEPCRVGQVHRLLLLSRDLMWDDGGNLACRALRSMLLLRQASGFLGSGLHWRPVRVQSTNSVLCVHLTRPCTGVTQRKKKQKGDNCWGDSSLSLYGQGCPRVEEHRTRVMGQSTSTLE